MSRRTLDGAQRVEGKMGGTQELGVATASHGVAGNIYRIVQMTGPDGKKLLKLLPVSETSGNAGPFIHAPVASDNTKVNASVSGLASLKTVLTQNTTVLSNTATSPFVTIPAPLTGAPGKLILQQNLNKVELMKVTHVVNDNRTITSSLAVQNNYVSADKLFLQKDAASVPSVKNNILMNTKNLPVVNSSVLPSVHHLQIPAHAEVKSVPASCLPPAIQQKILALAATNASVTPKAAKPPIVIYVSPVKTVKTPISKCLQNTNPTPAAEIPKPLVLTAAQTAVNNSIPDVVSHDSQEPGEAPMKWVVQENPQSASCLVPVRSSNDMVSKMLKTLVDKNVKNNPASTLPACLSSLSESHAKLSSVKDNALVMYNGKIYLLTRKGSSAESALDEKQVSATADIYFRKHMSQVTSSVADNTITNQIVSLVLSKNKGVALSAKDPKSCENVKSPLGSEWNKTLKVAPILLASPHRNLQIGSVSQQEAVSASENTPIGIKFDDKTGTEEDLNVNIIQKTHSPKSVALQSSTFDVSKEEEQKIEKINQTRMDVQIKQIKVQHRKQYTEIRKEFGLLKEERVYLRKLPVLNSVRETEETEWSSNVHTNDSCKLLQAITVKSEPEEEEMILGKQESNIKRNTELPESMLENAKRRKTLGPSSDHDDSSSVMDNPSSSCRQVISQQENPTVSLPFLSNGGSDPNTCMQTNEDSEVLCPTVHNITNETSFSASSLGEDSFLYNPPDLEETIKDEKIERLKLLLKKQEAALEEMRKKLQET
ncbi:ligand-dependent nuclear receptor-interacting factor 1 [Heteronotia binoei]|uniref:ligand-dependent nuclear receptor-interacting factor 1 n=1 Tax=Heteronotia binoei TaxID=13085 RepID=UPI00292E07A1|nr:ligand-dependent nuclear receptor-interacting factor 1 [Heteronotia binoei]